MTTLFRQLYCGDEQRRTGIREHEFLQGIDYLEVVTSPEADNQRVLQLYFIPKQTPAGAAQLEVMLSALAAEPERFSITGGVRITDVAITGVRRSGDHLEIDVNHAGDFSDYRLAIDYVRGQNDPPNLPNLDPAYAEIRFSFKAGCHSHFDCRPVNTCAPRPDVEPAINYLAKDYASFRQALLDRIAAAVPEWRERSVADLGIAVLETLAYTADQLSYYQDAVASEAFLETARQRISVRRHAKLIDYNMHDGASARAFVHFRVTSDGSIPEGTVLLSRVTQPIGSTLAPPREILPPDHETAIGRAQTVFETVGETPVDPGLNEIPLWAWGRRNCCHPRGTTTVDLEGDHVALLQAGSLLALEEVRGVPSGNAADADRAHRQVVRLTEVTAAFDPLHNQPVTRVTWSAADALVFPLCLSFAAEDGTTVEQVSVARGNLAVAVHGRRIRQWHPSEPTLPDAVGVHLGARAYRFGLTEGPLSFATPFGSSAVAPQQLPDPRNALPRIRVQEHIAGEDPRDWTPQTSLLSSEPADRHFLAEVDNIGRPVVRFGDGSAGAAPTEGSFLEIEYWTGSGAGGNIPGDALYHVLRPAAPPDWPAIELVRNPTPAFGGIDPASVDEVKLTAPAALRAGLFRAVTEADYAAAAEMHSSVAKAVATFRWTGSWHTVFVTIDPVGGTGLNEQVRREIHDWVSRFRQAGYDLEIQPPIYVPLDIEIEVCVSPTHFRSDVEQALYQMLSSGVLAGGLKGFFHPDRFTFGQPLHLSKLYATVAGTQGVHSARVRKFQRFAKAEAGELANGAIPAGRTEVIRLDNDPNFPENGRIRLIMLSGK